MLDRLGCFCSKQIKHICITAKTCSVNKPLCKKKIYAAETHVQRAGVSKINGILS